VIAVPEYKMCTKQKHPKEKAHANLTVELAVYASILSLHQPMPRTQTTPRCCTVSLQNTYTQPLAKCLVHQLLRR
jgi:hypothetical protein